MAQHLETGSSGEEIAANYLVSNGFTLLHRNWRYRHLEIDIIASKGKVLHFVEVKTRSSDLYGNPEDSVSKRKINFLKTAVNEYMLQHPEWKWIQLDIVAIIMWTDKPPEILLLEDVS
jgi:putative endonuclease